MKYASWAYLNQEPPDRQKQTHRQKGMNQCHLIDAEKKPIRENSSKRKQFEKTVREKTKSEATNELRIQRKPLKHQVVGRPRTRERVFTNVFLRTFFFKFVSYKTSEREERVDTDFKEKKKDLIRFKTQVSLISKTLKRRKNQQFKYRQIICFHTNGIWQQMRKSAFTESQI